MFKIIYFRPNQADSDYTRMLDDFGRLVLTVILLCSYCKAKIEWDTRNILPYIELTTSGLTLIKSNKTEGNGFKLLN